MITEDYVSFETAKLLKEKGFGFDGCATYYTLRGEVCQIGKGQEIGIAPRSTLQMAMKWLREKKGIAVIPVLSSVLDNEKFLWDIKIVVAKYCDTYSQGWVYERQEDACEAAIKYCLKELI